MAEILQKQYNRFVILNLLYESTKGNTQAWSDLRILASSRGIVNSDFIVAYDYLLAEKLIRPYGGTAIKTAYINHEGVKAIESALLNPTEATIHFPALKDMGI